MLIALSLGVGWLVAGRNLRPLRAIIATSRDISATEPAPAAEPGRPS